MTVHSVKAFTVGEWLVEPDLDRIRKGDEVRTLRPQVTELLVYLAQRPGEVVSTEALFDDLWAGKVVTTGSLYNCVAELRQALRDGPDSSLAIQTVPKRGYRLVMAVSGLADTAEPPAPEGRATVRKRTPTLKTVLGISLGVAILVALVARDRGWLLPSPSTSPIDSLGVLPLLNLSGDPEKDYFADGMTEVLTAKLGQIRTLKVISRTTMMQYKSSEKPLSVIARELGVDALIEGSVLWAEGDVRVTLQLIHGRTDNHLWSKSYRSRLSDVLALQSEVANNIAERIELSYVGSGEKGTEESAATGVSHVPNPAALQAYLKGRYHFNRVGLGIHDALQYYEQAIDIDPDFALAHAAFAQACLQPPIVMTGLLPLSHCAEAADRALELNERLAEAQAAVGSVRLRQWNWNSAEIHFERALAINPNSIMAHQGYAELLRTTMRSGEALDVMRRAEQLDPLNLYVKTMVGWPLFNLGRYKDSLEQWDHVLEMEPGYGLAHYNRGLAFIQLGQPRAALLAAERAADGMGRDSIAVSMLTAAAHALQGDTAIALEMLHRAEQKHGVRLAGWIAANYLLLGNEEAMFDWLEAGIAERVVGVAPHTSEPVFDPVRDDPRFQALRASMRLP